MRRAFVGLGSNVGDRLAHLRDAVSALAAADGIELGAISSVYDTDPVGRAQRNFLNAAIEISTTLTPRALLERLKVIEQQVGREPSQRWGPREIDLDLLLYADEVIDEPDLRVPHPQMAQRAFVLVPLAEIAPDVRVADATSDTSGVRPFAKPDALR